MLEKIADEIAKTVIDLASEVPELNKKGSEVNYHLKELCNRKNVFLIYHSKKIKASHLNSSRLHLNRKGTKILSNSLTQHISKVFN